MSDISTISILRRGAEKALLLFAVVALVSGCSPIDLSGSDPAPNPDDPIVTPTARVWPPSTI